MGSITEGFKSMSDSILSAVKEKIKQDQTKATNRLEATTINNAILMQVAQSGDKSEIDKAQLMIDAIGDTQPDASKLVYSSIQQRIKDKTDFAQTMQTESTKARMLGVNDVIKTLADKGGYSLAQLQEIGDAAYQNANIPIEQRVTNFTQSQDKTGSIQDILNQPIPAKKSDKQLQQDETMKHGLKILDITEKNYNKISEKYGTGRIKGIATTLRGKMGDLLTEGQQAPEVVPYLNNLEGLANFIGRSVYMDDRVSDINLKGYKKALAELSNTPAEAKIMFDTLREYSTTGSQESLEAVQMMVPKTGKPVLPSKAIKMVKEKSSDAQSEADAFLNGK